MVEPRIRRPNTLRRSAIHGVGSAARLCLHSIHAGRNKKPCPCCSTFLWTRGLCPRDGRRVALGGSGIAVHEVDPGAATPRIPPKKGPGGCTRSRWNPAWSPDGFLLGYSMEAEGGNTIRPVQVQHWRERSNYFRAQPKTVNWPDWLPDWPIDCVRPPWERGRPAVKLIGALVDFASRSRCSRRRERSPFLHALRTGKHIVYVSDGTGAPAIFVCPCRVLVARYACPRQAALPSLAIPTGRRSSTLLQTERPWQGGGRLRKKGLVLSPPRVAVRAIAG